MVKHKETEEKKKDVQKTEKTNIVPQDYLRSSNKRGTKRLKYTGDDTGANEAFLETLEEEELGPKRQEEEPGIPKRCRRTSPAPMRTKKSPKTSKSPDTASGGKRKATSGSKRLQEGETSSGDPPLKTNNFHRLSYEGC